MMRSDRVTTLLTSRRWLAVSAVVLATFVAISAQAQSSAATPVTRHVSLTATLDFEQKRIDGTERLLLENTSERPISSVSFLLNRLMSVRTAVSADKRSRFTQSVVRFADDSMRQVTRVVVVFPAPIQPHRQVSVTLAFGGNLVGYTETGSLYIRDRIDTAFTILRADAYAFPIVGVPNAATNRLTSGGIFTYDLDIVVPNGFVVSTAGTSATESAGAGRVRWHYRNAAASPFINICIARYDLRTEGGFRIASFPVDSDGAKQLAVHAQRAMRVLSNWFGPIASMPTVTISEIPEGWGSQASLTGGIIQEAGAFRETGQLRALYHELSHIWNATDNDRPSPRWNEGLAMFLQLRLAESVDGDTGTARSLARTTQRLNEALSSDRRLLRVPPANFGREQMTDYSYRVGQLMFAALFELLGQAEFNQVVGGYYQSHKSTGGTTDEFVKFANSNASKSPAALFGDWLYSTRWTDYVSRGLTAREVAALYR